MKKYYMLEICSEKEISLANIRYAINSVYGIGRDIQYIGVQKVEKQ